MYLVVTVTVHDQEPTAIVTSHQITQHHTAKAGGALEAPITVMERGLNSALRFLVDIMLPVDLPQSGRRPTILLTV